MKIEALGEYVESIVKHVASKIGIAVTEVIKCLVKQSFIEGAESGLFTIVGIILVIKGLVGFDPITIEVKYTLIKVIQLSSGSYLVVRFLKKTLTCFINPLYYTATDASSKIK